MMANALHFSSLKLFCLNFFFIHGAWVERLISDGDKNGKLFLKKKKINQNKTFSSIHIYSQSRNILMGLRPENEQVFYLKKNEFFLLKSERDLNPSTLFFIQIQSNPIFFQSVQMYFLFFHKQIRWFGFCSERNEGIFCIISSIIYI